MQERNITITNKLGLHARAAAKLVTMASGYSSDIDITRNDQSVNGKSIMGVMMLAASKGTELVIRTSGNDEQEAADNLAKLIAEKFGEKE